VSGHKLGCRLRFLFSHFSSLSTYRSFYSLFPLLSWCRPDRRATRIEFHTIRIVGFTLIRARARTPFPVVQLIWHKRMEGVSMSRLIPFDMT